MSRLLVFVLVASLGNASVAFAGDTLLTSATRMVQDLAHSQSASMSAVRANERRSTDLAVGSYAAAWVTHAVPDAPQAQQSQPGLASSGLKKRTKVAIAFGVAAGFAAVAFAIGRNVENTTPSTLGTRQD